MLFTKIFGFATVLFGVTVRKVVSIPVSNGEILASLDGYNLVPLTMAGKIDPDGPVHRFTGTLPDIHEQIRAAGGSSNATYSKAAADVSLPKKNQLPPVCYVPQDTPAQTASVLAAYLYLQEYAEWSCFVGPGPITCSALYCDSGKGAVWLCNYNDPAISPNCGYLSTYVGAILNSCNDPGAHLVNGQQYDTDRYSVVVGFANAEPGFC